MRGLVADPDPEDLPLHPAIVRWLAAYARAADGEKDDVVARMLIELNALLRRTEGRGGPDEEADAGRHAR
jgi:hypothetical protein